MKERLDVFLTEKGYYKTRNKARLAIESGDITVNGSVIDKSSYKVDETMEINILKDSIPYVSRGGLKLEKAIKSFNVEINGSICLDIGASTGGFSDCLLKHGAEKVYALDVGTNQLDESLIHNEKIISIENTNFRDINIKEYQSLNFNIISADVSFISLTYLLENVSKILNEYGKFIALIKPQFEVMKNQHNKNGLVNDKKLHFKVIQNIISCANEHGLFLQNLDYSPLRGEKSGNIEYLGMFSFKTKNVSLVDVNSIIDKAFETLKLK